MFNFTDSFYCCGFSANSPAKRARWASESLRPRVSHHGCLGGPDGNGDSGKGERGSCGNPLPKEATRWTMEGAGLVGVGCSGAAREAPAGGRTVHAGQLLGLEAAGV